MFSGMQHPSQKRVCCCLDCKEHCGGKHCEKGPGGANDCCASHIVKNNIICEKDANGTHLAPCVLPTTPPFPPPSPSPNPPPGAIFDNFSIKNDSLWNFANNSRSTQGTGDSFYLFNHSTANANLTNNEGRGLVMLMSSIPCKWNASECQGAAMASAHLSSTAYHGYGDYTLRMRAPHSTGHNPTVCDSGTLTFTLTLTVTLTVTLTLNLPPP